LPTLAAADPEPRLWISSDDATRRALHDGEEIRIFNGRGEMRARHSSLTASARHGLDARRWEGLNTLTSGGPVLPDAAVNLFEFSSGQAEFEAHVEVEATQDSCSGRLRPPDPEEQLERVGHHDTHQADAADLPGQCRRMQRPRDQGRGAGERWSSPPAVGSDVSIDEGVQLRLGQRARHAADEERSRCRSRWESTALDAERRSAGSRRRSASRS